MRIEGSAPATETQAKLFNRENEQSEAVSDRLLESVEEAPKPSRAAHQTGHSLDLAV